MKLIWQDWVLGAAFGFHLAALTITKMVYTSIAKLTQYANNIESNPAQRGSINLTFYSWVVNIIALGVILGFYLYLRHRIKKPTDYLYLNIAVCVIFLFNLSDALNDLGVLIGLVIH